MAFKLVILLLIGPCLISSCQPGNSKKHNDKTNKGETKKYQYDFAHPTKKWVLPHELKEISGNTWIDKDHLLIIEDLHPNLYLIRLGDSAIIEKTIPFRESTEKKFDIEDVTVVGNTAYALWSHGSIYKISNWQSALQVKEIPTNLSKENNTEGICFDPVSGNLLISCKKESEMDDEKKSTRSVFAYDLKADSLITEPFLLIHSNEIKKMTGEKVEFYPSGIAVNPQTHDIFVLSTKDNKCIARFTHDGQLKSLDFLDKDILMQPEGICFSPEGALYISSEGKHGEAPVIVEFDYKEK
jgi:uncharacterized protein YjiK